ncbi:MAG TPA: NAD(P)-dependent oxidoreductase, partial [Burkholderiales bacterium]|nr:NAD(P)-dependent oxidoreductase [Burkholderiales bacterium]
SRKPAEGVSCQHYPDLIEMAKAVDTLIVTVPGGASTAKIINADVLKALGPRGVVVNVARGSVVDEPALLRYLQEKKIAGAGLDVFADEPRVPPEFFSLDNAVLFPHVGSATVETRKAMGDLQVENLRLHFAGKPVKTRVV